jgi:hypothetical protein
MVPEELSSPQFQPSPHTMVPDELLPPNSAEKLAKFITKLSKPEMYVLKRFMGTRGLDDATNEILEDALSPPSLREETSLSILLRRMRNRKRGLVSGFTAMMMMMIATRLSTKLQIRTH